MAVLCTGSVAVDHIMVFRGRFKDVILPDKVHMLNVAFHVPELRRSFGGIAANIAYNLRLLGEDPVVLATVGDDFDLYAAWLTQHGIGLEHVVRLAGEATAGAYITTDLDRNQIIGFHPGAMDRAHEAAVARVTQPVELAVVSANGKQAMIEHARALKARGVPTLIDPGQGLSLFDGPELLELLDGAAVYVVNDYEWSQTLELTGLDEEAIAGRVDALIVTRGEHGSRLRVGGESQEIPSVQASAVVDPTGCGDAYRAGLIHGMCRGLPLEVSARMGSVMGALVAAEHGTQALRMDPAGFAERYRAAFGEEPA